MVLPSAAAREMATPEGTASRIGIATRTLLASGYAISGSHTQPRHVEIRCERVNAIGARVAVLVAITAEESLSPEELEDLQHAATAECRSVVIVGAAQHGDQLGWDEFLDALGGAVPSWRALGESYGDALLSASRNRLPAGLTGEPWRLFEDLVADGLEFLLGRAVRRLGARRRGRTVSDMLAQLPDGALLVVDAKAAEHGFNAVWDELRPLGEYVARQRERQRGHNDVFSALVVSSDFRQDVTALLDLSPRFYGAYGTPVAFLAAEGLLAAVQLLRAAPEYRNAMNWRGMLSGGRVAATTLERELEASRMERVSRETP
jgi:hypothetical protein